MTGSRHATRLANAARLAALSTLTLALAACAGEGLTGSLSSGQGGTASNLSGNAQTKDVFDPFNETDPMDRGRREVIKNPTRAQIMKPGPLLERAIGRKDAPVTVIKYASLTCPYCRRFQEEDFPVLKSDYIDTGKVRFIIREFPIGHQSGLATVAWRCAPASKFLKAYEAFMFNQRLWVSQEVRPEPIAKIAAKVGITRAQFNSCRKNQAMLAGLKWIKDRGRTLGIIGTPNFFINDKLVNARIGMKEMRAMIDAELAGRVATADTRKKR